LLAVVSERLSLAIDAVEDIDDCLDIALWSAALATPMLLTNRIEAERGNRDNFMFDILNEQPPSSESEVSLQFRLNFTVL
jgi:hypothetical protein